MCKKFNVTTRLLFFSFFIVAKRLPSYFYSSVTETLYEEKTGCLQLKQTAKLRECVMTRGESDMLRANNTV